MQSKKEYQEKLFARFQLSERIPKNNFYRRLKGVLDLDFLYKLTKAHYGESGQKSKESGKPLFGILIQFMGLRKINTIVLKQANKVMHLSAIAYNVKKCLKFKQKRVRSGAGKLALTAFVKSGFQYLFSASTMHVKLAFTF